MHEPRFPDLPMTSPDLSHCYNILKAEVFVKHDGGARGEDNQSNGFGVVDLPVHDSEEKYPPNAEERAR